MLSKISCYVRKPAYSKRGAKILRRFCPGRSKRVGKFSLQFHPNFQTKKGGIFMYRKVIDPDELYVSELLKEGFSLHSVTPFTYNSNSETQLVYHFIKEFTSAPQFGLDYTFPDVMIYGEKHPSEVNIKDINWHDNQ
jgi:hypothetical protein